MNGLTAKELTTRAAINQLLDSGEYHKAKKLCSAFLKNKRRRRIRRALMQTVKLFVPLMNGEFDNRGN